MIKKEFFEFNKRWTRYTIFDNIPTLCFELSYLSAVLDPWDTDYLGIHIINPSIDNTIFIYCESSFKEQAELEFETRTEEDAFEDAYIEYCNKREDEIPSIEISLFDWEVLKQKWEQIKKEKPEYVIFILDDSGPLDKVDIIGKDELSEQDKDYIKQEHEKYLKYQAARQKYIQNHPDYSEVWRGSQDDEYEVDIMKYYDDKL